MSNPQTKSDEAQAQRIIATSETARDMVHQIRAANARKNSEVLRDRAKAAAASYFAKPNSL